MLNAEQSKTELLRVLSVLLNKHQDLCDVLDDDTIPDDEERLASIRAINDEIGRILADALPG